jgi:Tol biopolymer transport system component
LSPGGTRIVFRRLNNRNGSVYVVNVDGSGLRRLPQLGSAQSLVWSPDGRSIAFNNSRGEIATIYPDGSHLQVLTHFSGAPGTAPGNPVWSPDGRRIAFLRTPGHPGAFAGELWVMNTNGSHLRRVYRQHTAALDAPDWSPDGRYIAFLGYSQAPYRPWELLVMDANGSHLRLLTWPASAPAWQPVP